MIDKNRFFLILAWASWALLFWHGLGGCRFLNDPKSFWSGSRGISANFSSFFPRTGFPLILSFSNRTIESCPFPRKLDRSADPNHRQRNLAGFSCDSFQKTEYCGSANGRIEKKKAGAGENVFFVSAEFPATKKENRTCFLCKLLKTGVPVPKCSCFLDRAGNDWKIILPDLIVFNQGPRFFFDSFCLNRSILYERFLI